MYGPRISEHERMLHYEHMCTLRELAGQGPKSVSEAVRDAQRNVADLWRQSADNTLRIGYWLNTLHELMDAEKFSAYTRDDLADLGISRSSAYRWMVLDKNLQRVFPNSALCDALVRLGDGRGIFAAFRVLNKDKDKAAPVPAANSLDGAAQSNNAETDNKDGESNPSQFPLTAAAQEALAGLPAPPSAMEGYKQANDWARSFIKAMNQARARQRAEKCAARKTAVAQEESLLKRLEDFAAGFGAEAFENFRERLDRLFGPRKIGATAEGPATQAGVQSPGVQSNVRSNVQPNVQSDVQSDVQSNVQSNVGTQSQRKTEPASAGAEASPSVAQSRLRTEGAQTTPTQAEKPRVEQTAILDEGRVKPLSVPSISSAASIPSARQDHPAGGNSSFQSHNRTGTPPQQKESAPTSNPQPKAPNVGRTMYPDEPRSSPYAQDFVFRLPGSQRRP
jgi:hypothetical protein